MYLSAASSMFVAFSAACSQRQPVCLQYLSGVWKLPFGSLGRKDARVTALEVGSSWHLTFMQRADDCRGGYRYCSKEAWLIKSW